MLFNSLLLYEHCWDGGKKRKREREETIDDEIESSKDWIDSHCEFQVRTARSSEYYVYQNIDGCMFAHLYYVLLDVPHHQHQDSAAAAFINIMNHRLIWLPLFFFYVNGMISIGRKGLNAIKFPRDNEIWFTLSITIHFYLAQNFSSDIVNI